MLHVRACRCRCRCRCHHRRITVSDTPGGGATGHPVEWIHLDKRQGKVGARVPETCKYCGVRYVMTEKAVHSH